MQEHIPSRTEHSSARSNYDGRLDTLSASTQGCFARRALAGAPICQPKRSPDEGRFSGGGERGKIISPSSLFSSSSSSPKDSDSEGDPPSHAFAAAQATPLSHSFYFRARCLSFLVRLASHLAISSGRMTPRGSLRTHPRPYNMSATGIKK
jgi:hypothetical protein